MQTEDPSKDQKSNETPWGPDSTAMRDRDPDGEDGGQQEHAHSTPRTAAQSLVEHGQFEIGDLDYGDNADEDLQVPRPRGDTPPPVPPNTDDQPQARVPLPAPAIDAPPIPPSEDAYRDPATPIEFHHEPKPLPSPNKSPSRQRKSNLTIGIVGGPGTGKSYLFQAMVYRLGQGKNAGALTPFLRRGGAKLFNISEDGQRSSGLTDRMAKSYRRWEPLPATKKGGSDIHGERSYALELRHHCLLPWVERTISIDYHDRAGEELRSGVETGGSPVWREDYSQANVMIFCLPFWSVFPRPDLDAKTRKQANLFVDEFIDVLGNYRTMRENYPAAKTRSILALTMADDQRGALEDVRTRWIKPLLNSSSPMSEALERGKRTPQYLEAARHVSNSMRSAFQRLDDKFVGSFIDNLDFGAGEPWVIPLSAIDGHRLEDYERQRDEYKRGRGPEVVTGAPPVPIHVELPLLVALSEHANILM